MDKVQLSKLILRQRKDLIFWVVLLFNTIVPKMQAFHLTLLSFAGQIAAGFFIDLLCGTASDSASLLGGGIVSAGILINLLTEHLLEKRAKKTAS